MKKQIISTDAAPAAIGPYSQAVRVGQMIFFSGQIPIDPETGELVAGGIEVQAERVMQNMEAVLRAAELGFQDVIKTTIFLTDLGDFAKVNAIYGSRFPDSPPARACVQVAALPKEAAIEIEWIAASVGNL